MGERAKVVSFGKFYNDNGIKIGGESNDRGAIIRDISTYNGGDANIKTIGETMQYCRIYEQK